MTEEKTLHEKFADLSKQYSDAFIEAEGLIEAQKQHIENLEKEVETLKESLANSLDTFTKD